jgi:glucose/mannose transport system substrate-binding protein
MNKGSIPARLDADPSGFDESARATMSAFQREVRVPTLTSLVPRVFSLALDAAMGSFMVTRDVEEIMRVIKGHYPELAG